MCVKDASALSATVQADRWREAPHIQYVTVEIGTLLVRIDQPSRHIGEMQNLEISTIPALAKPCESPLL
jgi:hypothetical protein